MTARTIVTPESVQTYLAQSMNRDNYHLMYGLHLLSHDRFTAVMDALINGDLQTEELVRLNGFTDADADALTGATLSGWTIGSVAVPSTGTTGYAYLTRTLGMLAASADPVMDPQSISPHRFVNAMVHVGVDGHESLEEVDDIFHQFILPEALDGLALSYYIPADAVSAENIPTPNQDAERSTRVGQIAASVYAPLIGPDNIDLLHRFIPVGREPCALREAPGLAEWLLRSSHPATGTKLLLHREAASRTAIGEYTLAELESWLIGCENTLPSHVGTTRSLVALSFRLWVLRVALNHHFPAQSDLIDRTNVLDDALTGLLNHRDRLRGFARRILSGCEKYLIGTYPPA